MNIMNSFRRTVSEAKNVLILTDSGINEKLKIPRFNTSGYWRMYRVKDLATPVAFARNPSLVWEFYEYHRRLAKEAEPNKAHKAIADFQANAIKSGKKVTIITQNIDELHQRAGAKDVIELHGSLYQTHCTLCRRVAANRNIPICPALAGKGSPDPNIMTSNISTEDLPRCEKENCKGLLRPHIVWFNEGLEEHISRQAFNAVQSCDACLIIGTSWIASPGAMFALQVANRGISVAEFNVKPTPATRKFKYYFGGPCTVTVTKALAPETSST